MEYRYENQQHKKWCESNDKQSNGKHTQRQRGNYNL